jgi:hypothetical protein
MANILSKTGIQANNVIQPWHITQSIDAFAGTSAYDITLSGSLDITGPLNLNSPVTGNLITSASYTITSSFALTAVSASNVNYALTSSDATFLQLHHGLFQNPTQNTVYYFALEPLSGSGITLTTDSGKVGTYFPKTGITFNKCSITTTVQGTVGTSETSTYNLIIGGSNVSLPSLSHNQPVSSSTNTISDISLSTLDSRIYVTWRTPITWVTAPTSVSHNIVLYGTRGTANI